MKNGRHKKQICANYTVEAAFIVPMVLGILFAMIYMLFFLHDRVILQENLRADVINIAESKYKNNDDEKQNKVITKRQISNNLIILKIKNLNCNVGKMYISAEVCAISKIDIPVITYFMNRKKSVTIKTRYLKLKPDNMVFIKQKYSQES